MKPYGVLGWKGKFHMSENLKSALLQSGVKGRSGRYALGSGARPYQDDRFDGSSLRKSKSKGGLNRFKNLLSKGKKKTKELAEDEVAAQSEKLKKKLSEVNEHDRERNYIDMYKHRDKMSTQAIREQINRIKAEQELEQLVYAKENSRKAKAAAEAKAKRQKNAKRIAALAGLAGSMELEKLVKDPKQSDYFEDIETATAAAKERYENAKAGAEAARKIVKAARKGAGMYSQYYRQMNGGK
jgi:hypothetical protein